MKTVAEYICTWMGGLIPQMVLQGSSTVAAWRMATIQMHTDGADILNKKTSACDFASTHKLGWENNSVETKS